MATRSDLNLTLLASYATLGAVFFLLSAWRLRSSGAAARPRIISSMDV